MPSDHKTYELVVEPREIIGKKSKQLRRQGLIPAVVYGHNVKAESVQVPQKELEHVYMRAGNNGLVDLKVGEKDKARKVFIHRVQRNPLNHVVAHVDFMVVNLREEMTATVPIVLTGEAPAVKNREGLLLHALDHIQIRTLPTDIPPMIEADISGLDEVDKAIHVSDLQLPGNVTLLTPGDELVAKITALPVEEVVEVPEAEEAAEAPEGAPAEGAGEQAPAEEG
jgi:large subunit ribosomal protein L25